MSVKHLISRMTPSLSHANHHAVANRTPSPAAMQRVAAGFNHVSGRQKKVVLFRMQNYRAIYGGSSAAINVWPGYFRTGENTTAVVVYVGLTTTPFVTVSPPSFRCLIKTTAGVTVNAAGEGTCTYDGASAGATVTPDEVSYKKMVITGLSSNTEYRIENEVTNGACLLYLMIREASVRHADDSVAGVCSPDKFANQGPIYDEHVEDLCNANNLLWRHNGAHLFSWAADYEINVGAAGLPTVTGNTSYTDVYTARPFTLQTLYHNTRRRTTVPLRMAVLADRTGGTGTLDVRITDGTNSIAVTGMADGGLVTWVAATGSLPAQLASYHLEARHSNGTTTHRILGVSLFSFET